MREIKFRCWVPTLKIMNYNVAIHANKKEDSIQLIFMQYSGLKDKNGKEIYEGDIITMFTSEERSSTMEVKFSDGAFNIASMVQFGHKALVLGNIYENTQPKREAKP